jgi:hypothetical protein
MQRLWLNRNCVIAAWVGLALAALSPRDGLGVPLCFFHSTTGIDCIGCGLTRSLSCAMRGSFAQSWGYHPMGIFILALFTLIALQSVLPKTRRQQIGEFVERHAVGFRRFYIAFVGMFIAFGIVRAVVEIAASMA